MSSAILLLEGAQVLHSVLADVFLSDRLGVMLCSSAAEVMSIAQGEWGVLAARRPDLAIVPDGGRQTLAEVAHVALYVGNGLQINAPTTYCHAVRAAAATGHGRRHTVFTLSQGMSPSPWQVVSVSPRFTSHWDAHHAGTDRVRT
jgi:hypothetical protein